MAAGRTRYELRVATLLSRAALATFRVPVKTTVMPRNTVYRLRVSADRDPSELLDRLTECDVEVLEIRRCPEPSRRVRAEPVRQEALPPATEDPDRVTAGVVIPFPVRSTARRQRGALTPGECSSTEPEV
jgi:hypothetical protein